MRNNQALIPEAKTSPTRNKARYICSGDHSTPLEASCLELYLSDFSVRRLNRMSFDRDNHNEILDTPSFLSLYIDELHSSPIFFALCQFADSWVLFVSTKTTTTKKKTECQVLVMVHSLHRALEPVDSDHEELQSMFATSAYTYPSSCIYHACQQTDPSSGNTRYPLAF